MSEYGRGDMRHGFCRGDRVRRADGVMGDVVMELTHYAVVRLESGACVVVAQFDPGWAVDMRLRPAHGAGAEDPDERLRSLEARRGELDVMIEDLEAKRRRVTDEIDEIQAEIEAGEAAVRELGGVAGLLGADVDGLARRERMR